MTVPKGGWEPSDQTLEAAASREALEEGLTLCSSLPVPPPLTRSMHAFLCPVAVVYPPCAVRSIESAVEVSEASEQQRGKYLVYIAQFRPEKNHQLILRSFARFLRSGSAAAAEGATLVLLGSVRDSADSRRVYELRLLVNELHIKERVVFQLDAAWGEVLEWLRKGYVGVNGMWNEHFGIGVVEYLAAGLIPVVHDSGGPKLDIVTEVDGEPTGNACHSGRSRIALLSTLD